MFSLEGIKPTKKSLFKGIKAVVFDVDGVMTDGGVLVFPDGEHVRKFNVKDGWGIRALIENDFDVVVISAGSGEGLRKRLSYLGIQNIFLATKDKKAVLDKYCLEKGIAPSEIAYMGDDMPDLKIIQNVKLPCCPIDAIDSIRKNCKFISKYKGGQGAVRELSERLLKAKHGLEIR